MADALLATENLIKQFGGVTATDRLSLSVMEGELHAVIGPNGAGKTTLVAQLAGELAPSAGRIRFAGADITALGMAARARRGLARSFQIASLCREFSALDNVALAVQAQGGHGFRFRRAPSSLRSGSPGARTFPPACWRMASSGSSSSPWRLPASRACCSLTSRWRGWDRRMRRS
jgi:branched-chain amino acid transport system ATP-binding protein